jgi:TetR/AcrR family transcriptional regulator, transcriptional repressor for nem operon
MRYVKGHGLQTRSRIVEEASYGLRQAGVDGISVSDLMKLAGLTLAASTLISNRAKP